ncbi:WD40 repeat-containing protein [Tieghemostelium lacteum]|uniref:WD40 repeat-containing protein n=1 Tax=Tieghemostelium lacteum TaxID=361077 RepID=A0A151Z5R0_TIELA|nr:WD40 repeat-containing protein [Tieghemostelium lacteum]|eukprot:KYQ89285.1 WD40 repeat-containing protein [Tieghemostelium lacteum]
MNKFDSAAKLYVRRRKDKQVEIWNCTDSKLIINFLEKHPTSTVELLNTSSEKGGVSVNKQLLALGTHKGDVVIFDITSNKQLKLLKNAKDSSKINHIVFSHTGDYLYSSNDNGMIVQWDISQGSITNSFMSKHKVTAMAINSSSTILATANIDIKLWDLSSMKLQRKLKGHSAEVTQLHFTSDSHYLMSTNGDRFLHVWNMNDQKSEEEIAVLSGTANVGQVSDYKVSKDLYFIASMNAHREISFWSFVPNKTKGSIKSQYIYKNKSDIMNFKLISDQKFIMASAPELSTLSFQKGTYSEDGKTISSTIKYTVKTQEEKESKKSKKQEKESDESSQEEEESSEEEEESSEEEEESSEEEEEKKTKMNGKVEDKKNKFDSKSKPIATASGNAAKLSALDFKIELKDLEKIEGSTDSVITLILQALRASDNGLLAKAMHVKPIVIKNTVKVLPSLYAYNLLTKIVVDLAIDGNRAAYILPWISEILLQHSSYLLTIPDLSTKLSILNNFIEDKVQLYNKISKLIGKINLINSQTTLNQFDANQRPKLLYDENNSNDSDSEEDDQDLVDDEPVESDDSMKLGSDSEDDDDEEDDDDLDDEFINDLMDEDDE